MKIANMVLLGCCLALFTVTQGFAGDHTAENRFTLLENGIVLDTKSQLMWAPEDNGADINWTDSEEYCRDFNLGGYSDWRLPTIEELESLYDSEKRKEGEFGITAKIKLTDCCVWSADESMRSSAIFSFRSGKKPWGFQGDTARLRVLPVRDDRSKAFKHNL